MLNEKLISKYMEFNKVLMATVYIDNKTVVVFDGSENKTFSYRSFFIYLADHFAVQPTFIDKGVVVLESIDPENQLLEIDAEYNNLDGSITQVVYHIVKQSDNEFMLFIKKLDSMGPSNIDQMTKANDKSYIDNWAKNNILTKTPFVLMYIDIDNFKHINDEYGQVFGDMVLIEMVSIFKNVLGDNGSIARVGGDRFLVIYDIEDEYDKAHDFLFDLKQQVQSLSCCAAKGISLTITIGSAQYPKDGNYQLMLRKCEKALIRGKNKGRDCFIMYLEEKCGKVTLDDEITDQIVKIDNVSAKNDIYSLIININQVLSNESSFDESIDKAISLVGSYFYVDRVSIARLDIQRFKIMKHHVWYNPKITTKHEVYCQDDIIPIWGKALGPKFYIKVDDEAELPNDYPLKKIFPIDHTTASMSFELVVNEKSFGLIRFDMTTGKRHWSPENLQVFLLISQLFASYLQKNYLKETNYNTIYCDPKYNCNNFTKMFKDAGEYIVNNKITDYTIVELEVRNMSKYRNILGVKRVKVAVDKIADIFTKSDCIYGKYHEGPFIVFYNHHNKEIIERDIKLVSDSLVEFSNLNNISTIYLQPGIYLANSAVDRLADAISNASLTRLANKTEKPLYYSDKIKNDALFKSEMILRVDEAIHNGEFLLYLQPKISTVNGKLVGAEALTRWKYKNEKLLFPDQFIGIFEENGIIEKLDYSVFDNVCKYQSELIKDKLIPVPISVNVSRYVHDFDRYIQNMEKIRKKYDISSDLIEIEITEGMYYENSSTISDFISKLHNVGYRVSMDDFGSGYSNLVSLAKLNFDTIKFDRSFCLNLDDNNVKIMLDKLIVLIKTLNKDTLCEGVETKENVDYLTKIGCDSIQGYYYSKPIPYQEFRIKYYGK
ncbi:MAG: EAL domain-containing protein [Acholeplasmatales bacterium]|nr:EAL domain-containing protein [Acholeplasmatales bacterium]